MPIPVPVWNGREWVVSSWTDGLIPNPIYQETLSQEAAKCPEAVINRLMRLGLWEQAEEIMDTHL